MQVVYDRNPWFTEEGSLDEEVWGRVGKNTGKAYKQKGDPYSILGQLDLIQTIIKILKEDEKDINLYKER